MSISIKTYQDLASSTRQRLINSLSLAEFTPPSGGFIRDFLATCEFECDSQGQWIYIHAADKSLVGKFYLIGHKADKFVSKAELDAEESDWPSEEQHLESLKNQAECIYKSIRDSQASLAQVLAKLTTEEFEQYRILDQIQSRASRLDNMRFLINEVLHGINLKQSDDLLAPTTAQIDDLMSQYRRTKSAGYDADREFYNMRESLAYYRWLNDGRGAFSGRTPDVVVS